MNINCWHGCGNLTRDPELTAAGESHVCKFSIAINRTWKDRNGEKKEEVTFVDCEAWGKTAELIGQYLTKGSECYVEGRLKLDAWEDKKTGEKRSKLKIIAEKVQFGRKPQGGGAGGDAIGEAEEDAAIAGARRAANRQPAPARAAAPARPAAGGDDEPPF